MVLRSLVRDVRSSELVWQTFTCLGSGQMEAELPGSIAASLNPPSRHKRFLDTWLLLLHIACWPHQRYLYFQTVKNYI
jgi:hypothetical protein